MGHLWLFYEAAPIPELRTAIFDILFDVSVGSISNILNTNLPSIRIRIPLSKGYFLKSLVVFAFKDTIP